MKIFYRMRNSSNESYTGCLVSNRLKKVSPRPIVADNNRLMVVTCLKSIFQILVLAGRSS